MVKTKRSDLYWRTRLMGNSKLVWWGVTGLYVAVLLVLSLVRFPSIGDGPKIPHLDKVAHFLSYAVLVALLYKSLNLGLITERPKLSAFFLAVVFGVVVELLQLTLTDYRFFSIADMAANFLGASLAIALTFVPATKG